MGLFMSVQSPNSVAFSRCCQRYHTCVGFAENTSFGQLNTYNLISHKYKDRFLYFNYLCMSLLVLYILLSTTADAPSYCIINFHEFPIPVFLWEPKKLASILLSYPILLEQNYFLSCKLHGSSGFLLLCPQPNGQLHSFCS